MGICGFLFLALGILFLLVDFGVWNFWGIQWWSAIFVLMGIGALAQKSCPDCMAMKKGR
ncbi:MAG: hypothetical protein HYS32_00830 [Candidatus Woesearchaeota archaeon]|nr:MAG: hypothetical protein HYS32_00830 [Candidatus Woesearchaeota archaeon]